MESQDIKKQINYIFDKQIILDEKFRVHKELFNLTFDFTLNDWRNIRTEKYWIIRDQLDYDEQKEHTLYYVKQYIKNKIK